MFSIMFAGLLLYTFCTTLNPCVNINQNFAYAFSNFTLRPAKLLIPVQSPVYLPVLSTSGIVHKPFAKLIYSKPSCLCADNEGRELVPCDESSSLFLYLPDLSKNYTSSCTEDKPFTFTCENENCMLRLYSYQLERDQALPKKLNAFFELNKDLTNIASSYSSLALDD